MADRKRRWLSIAVGIVFLLVCVAIGLVVVAVSVFRESVDTQTATADSAEVAFDEVLRRFPDRQPLIEISEGGTRRATIAAAAHPASTVELQSMKILVWDPDDARLARVTLPFWLLRMKSGPIELGQYGHGLDDEARELRIEDLEEYGPGIVIAHTARRGERVLVWVE